MFTILPGTTITFTIVLSPINLAVSGSSLTVFSTSAGEAALGRSTVKRVLPLKETGYVTLSSTVKASLYSGNSAYTTLSE